MTGQGFTIEIRASRYLLGLLALMHLLALAASWRAELSLFWQWLLSVLLAGSLIYYGRQYRRHFVSSMRLQYQTDLGWRLTAAGGNWQAIQLKQLFISRPLLIINYRQAARRKSLLLLPDSSDADSLRQLRVLLRHA